MANKTRNDLNVEIIDIIKSNPGATDITKLQGKNHRQLLKDILDYVDEQIALAKAAAAGEFPFDWTVPSNAFNNYSNPETTFSKGMWKFLHREMPPKASLTASNAVRQKGSSTAVVLTYSATVGSAALKTIVVDGSTVGLAPSNGTLNRTLAANTNKVFTMTVTDTSGLSTQAFAEVTFLNKLFICSSATDFSEATDATISAALVGVDGLLTTTRTASSAQNTQNPNNEYIYIAYPASFGGNPKIIVNTIQDNSFTERVFNFTNSNGYVEQYYIYKSANLLSSTYNIALQ